MPWIGTIGSLETRCPGGWVLGVPRCCRSGAAQVYDFVDVKTELVSPNEVIATQHRLPLRLAGYVSTINAIYIDVALAVCGVDRAEVAIGDPTPHGELIDVPLIVRWR